MNFIEQNPLHERVFRIFTGETTDVKMINHTVEKYADEYAIKKTKNINGAVGEHFFAKLFETEGFSIQTQVRNSGLIYDLLLNGRYVIEIKVQLGPGSAHEKLYSIPWKYKNDEHEIYCILCGHYLLNSSTVSNIAKENWEIATTTGNSVKFIRCSEVYKLITTLKNYINYTPIKPFLKWVGGKGICKDRIVDRIFMNMGERTKNIYAEPFLGGGSVLFEILNRLSTNPIKIDTLYCSDINESLIGCYKNIQSKTIYPSLRKELMQIPKICDINESMYYQYRDEYNTLIHDKSNHLRLTVLFITLNKTCFRGLHRVNAKGEFNVPYGHYKTDSPIVDINNLDNIHRVLNKFNVQFKCVSYDIHVRSSGILLYMDPPYVDTFNDYTDKGFDQDKFKEDIITIAKNNRIIMSNSTSYEHPSLTAGKEVIPVNDRINSKSPEKQRVEVLVWN